MGRTASERRSRAAPRASRRTALLAGGGLLVVLAGLLAWIASDPPTPGGRDVSAREAPLSAPGVLPAPMPAAPVPVALPEPALAEVDAPAPLELVRAIGALAAAHETAAREDGDGSNDLALTVVVVDGAALPVPDARLELLSAGAPGLDALTAADAAPLATHFTNGAGLCELVFPARDALLVAERQGVGTAGPWRLDELRRHVDARGAAVVVLRPPAALSGVVLAHDGTPTPGARVVLGRVARGAGEGRAPAAVVTDGAGRFALAVDAGAELSVHAELGELRSPPQHVPVEPGAALEVTLRLPGPWSIDGVLVDDADEPVAGGTVTLWRRVEPDERPYRVEARTGAGGAFRFDLPALGEYVLVGRSARTAASDPAEVSVSAGRPRAVAWLRLPAPSAIAGRLVDGAGAPLPGVTVRARPLHLYDPQAMEHAPTVWTRLGEAADDTGDDGRFTLAPLHPDGSYIVFCRPDAARPDRKLVVKDVWAGTEELLLVASEESLRRAVVSGRVVEAGGGAPVAVFDVRLVIELDGQVLDAGLGAALDGRGGFRFEGLAPGYDYALRVDAPGRGAHVEPWWEASSRDEHVVLARLPPAGALDLIVRDATERPAARARVLMRRTGDVFGVDRRKEAFTDEAGRARFDELVPGRYAVDVEHGERRAEVEIEVPSGERPEVVVEVGRN